VNNTRTVGGGAYEIVNFRTVIISIGALLNLEFGSILRVEVPKMMQRIRAFKKAGCGLVWSLRVVDEDIKMV
jgi:hypothetical protein